MDVELPDGTVVEDVPDGLSQRDLVSMLSKNGHDTSWYKAPSPGLIDRVKSALTPNPDRAPMPSTAETINAPSGEFDTGASDRPDTGAVSLPGSVMDGYIPKASNPDQGVPIEAGVGPLRKDFYDTTRAGLIARPVQEHAAIAQSGGMRLDGTAKGPGWLGTLQRPDGDTSTELSIGVNIGGKETEIPSLVPTLSKSEVAYLLDGGKPTDAIVQKAVAHAKRRMAAGESPFAPAGGSQEQKIAAASLPGRLDRLERDMSGTGQARTEQEFVDDAGQGRTSRVDGELTSGEVLAMSREAQGGRREEPKPEGFDVFTNAVMRGIHNNSAMLAGLAAAGARAAGADDLSLSLLKETFSAQAAAGKYGAQIKDFTHIKNWSDVPTYALEGVVENAPQLIGPIGSGVVGGLVAKNLGAKAVAGMVREQAQKELMKRIALGSAAGAGAASVGMETGSIYGDIARETGEQRPGVAAAFGAVAGALDAIPAFRAARTVLGDTVAKQVASSVVKRYGKEALIQLGAEGGTEFVQTLIEKGAVSYVDGKPVFTEKNMIEAVDAMLKGGIAGAAVGVGSMGVGDAGRAVSSRTQDLTAGMQFDPGQIDAAARQSLDPANAQIQRTGLISAPPVPHATPVDILAAPDVDTAIAAAVDSVSAPDAGLLAQIEASQVLPQQPELKPFPFPAQPDPVAAAPLQATPPITPAEPPSAARPGEMGGVAPNVAAQPAPSLSSVRLDETADAAALDFYLRQNGAGVWKLYRPVPTKLRPAVIERMDALNRKEPPNAATPAQTQPRTPLQGMPQAAPAGQALPSELNGTPTQPTPAPPLQQRGAVLANQGKDVPQGKDTAKAVPDAVAVGEGSDRGAVEIPNRITGGTVRGELRQAFADYHQEGRKDAVKYWNANLQNRGASGGQRLASVPRGPGMDGSESNTQWKLAFHQELNRLSDTLGTNEYAPNVGAGETAIPKKSSGQSYPMPADSLAAVRKSQFGETALRELDHFTSGNPKIYAKGKNGKITVYSMKDPIGESIWFGNGFFVREHEDFPGMPLPGGRWMDFWEPYMKKEYGIAKQQYETLAEDARAEIELANQTKRWSDDGFYDSFAEFYLPTEWRAWWNKSFENGKTGRRGEKENKYWKSIVENRFKNPEASRPNPVAEKPQAPSISDQGDDAVASTQDKAAPEITQRKDGTITVKGYTKEQMTTARDALGIKSAIISEKNGVFPAGTPLAALKEALNPGAAYLPSRDEVSKMKEDLREFIDEDNKFNLRKAYNHVQKHGIQRFHDKADAQAYADKLALGEGGIWTVKRVNAKNGVMGYWHAERDGRVSSPMEQAILSAAESKQAKDEDALDDVDGRAYDEILTKAYAAMDDAEVDAALDAVAAQHEASSGPKYQKAVREYLERVISEKLQGTTERPAGISGQTGSTEVGVTRDEEAGSQPESAAEIAEPKPATPQPEAPGAPSGDVNPSQQPVAGEAPKTIAEASTADLLRAAADKMDAEAKPKNESDTLKKGTILYHGTQGEFSIKDSVGTLYLTDSANDAAAFGLGIIPGMPRTDTPSTVEIRVTKDSRVKDIDDLVQDAVENADDLDQLVINESKKAKDEGYAFVKFSHPSVDGGEMNVWVAARSDMIGVSKVASEKPVATNPKAPVSSVDGQKNLANRGSRIAALKMMNEQIRKLDPTEAWHDSNIEDAQDLDSLQDRISQTLVDLQRAAAPVATKEPIGDEFNARQLEQNLAKPSQADKDGAEEYLFGEQPAVPRPLLKPLSGGVISATEDADGKVERVVSEDEPARGGPRYAVGQRITVVSGAFSGVSGVVGMHFPVPSNVKTGESVDYAVTLDGRHGGAVLPEAFLKPEQKAEKQSADTTLTVKYGGSELDIDLGKPAYQATMDDVEAAVRAKGYSADTNPRTKYDPMQMWRNAHATAVAKAAKGGKPIPARVLYDYRGLIRSNLDDEQADLAADRMVEVFRDTNDYEKAVQAYRDFGKPSEAAKEGEGGSQFSPLEKELAAKVHDVEATGDVGVVVGGGKVKFVSLADAVTAAKKAIDTGTKAVPFQIHNATGIRIGDVDRVLAETKETDTGTMLYSIEPANLSGREFWRKIKAGETFTEQELEDAYSIGRRGTTRAGQRLLPRVFKSAREAAREAFVWQGKIAGFDGYQTYGRKTAADEFHVGVIPEELDAQYPDGIDIFSYTFSKMADGKYRLDVDDPKPGTPAFEELEKRGRIEETGNIGSNGLPYYRVKLDDRYTTSRALLQEAVRRLALEIGEVPSIVQVGRETGARAEVSLPREFSADAIESHFSVEASKAADRAIAQEAQESEPETKRGAGWLKIKLQQAKHKGELSARAVEMVEYLVKQNPALVKHLAVAIENPKEFMDGFNQPASKVGASGTAFKAVDTGSKEFKAWSGGHQIISADDYHEFKSGEGVTVKALHGTTGDIDAFGVQFANIESDLGGGFYFTNNPADAEENYAGLGPDLTNKVEQEAERIEQALEDDESMEGATADEVRAEAMRRARKQYMANDGTTMPVFVRFDNPVVLGGDNETFLSYEESYDEENDEYGEPEGDLVKFIGALRDVGQDERYGDAEIERAIGDLMERAMDNGGIKASAAMEILSASEGLQYATDYENERGALASKEIIRKAFEWAGFDGFIDQTVNSKFGSAKRIGKPMSGMDENTVHFVAFHPTQIKSSISNSGQFSRENPDIRQSLNTSTIAGNYNPFTEVLTLFRGNASDTTAVHEILHHMERMMPADMQAEIRKEWKAAVTAELAKAEKAGDEKRVAYFKAVLAGKQKEATELLMGMGADGFNAVSPAPTFKAVDTGSAEFREWFGKSVVVDSDGNPLRVYHVSQDEFTQFKPLSYGTAGDHSYFYFAKSRAWAEKFQQDERYIDGNLYVTYLSIQNPLDMRGLSMSGPEWLAYFEDHGVKIDGIFRKKLNESSMVEKVPAWKVLRFDTPKISGIRERLIASGYDGLIIDDVRRGKMDNTSYVTFLPEQIKSATSNNGEFSRDNPSILYSRAAMEFDPSRRQFVLGTAAALALKSAHADPLSVGKAKAIGADVLGKQVDAAVAKVLRGNGATSTAGAQALKTAMGMIATTGPAELRPLAVEIASLLPGNGILLTVDDRSLVNAHGVVKLNPVAHMTLFTADGRAGLAYETVLHEAMHAALAARYRAISMAAVRSNDARLKMAAPQAAPEMEQFIKVWREFRDVARRDADTTADKKLALSLRETGSPDEFFVRTLTDPVLQAYMQKTEYQGKTLFERFKDWVKTSLLGLLRSGTTPSWLDAALLATNDLKTAMVKDAADFKRLQASNKEIAAQGSRERSAMFSRGNPSILESLNTGTDYQYLNPSEFWAVNTTKKVEARFNAQSSIWARSLQWLKEALEHFKSFLGLRSDHPTVKALDWLIEHGNGERLSGEMLGSAALYSGKRQQLDMSYNRTRGLLNTSQLDGSTADQNHDIIADPPSEEANKVQAGIEGKSARDAALFIAKTDPNKARRLIAYRVARQIQKMEAAGLSFNLKVGHLGEQVHAQLAGNMRGITWRSFDSKTTDIWVQGSDVTGLVGVSYETVLHELLHAVTQSAIYIGQQPGNTDLHKNITDLKDVHRAIISHFNGRIEGKTVGELDNRIERAVARDHNALREMGEVVSWALTNRDMQDYLESIPYQGGTLWSRFVSAVRKSLGLPAQSDTVLSEILRITDRLLDSPTQQLVTITAPTMINYSGGLKNESGSSEVYSSVEKKGIVKDATKQAKETVLRLAGRPMLDPGDPFAAENARLREHDQSLWANAKKQLRRYLAPGGLLPQPVFNEKIKRDSEFQAVEFDVRHLVGGLDRAIKADFGKPLDKLSKEQMRKISDALAGDVLSTLPEATKTAAVAMRQYIDTMSGEYLKIIQERIDAKMLKALETDRDADKAQAINEIELYEKIKGNVGRYVHRSYQAFDDPKWFEKVPAGVLNMARAYLKQGYVEAGETDARAAKLTEVTLHEILKNGTAYDSMESFIAESKLGAKDLSVLMRRKEVPSQIRALLGEYPDARLNFTKSATKMGRLIWNTRFLDRVRDIGMNSFFFEGKDRPPGATTQIAADGSEVYAPLNGLWTFPETAQAFKDALGKEQMSDLYRVIVRANGLVKYGKTVLSPTTAMRNWQSAMFFSLANGHFDLTQMKKSVAAFREQVAQTASGGDLKYLRHLKQLGVVYDVPYAGEMARLMDDARMEELLSTDKGDAVRWFRKANQIAQGFYTFGDDFWKIIGFENEKAGLMKAGLNLQEAEAEAAKRIRDTYPTYSMVGRGVQWLSRFPLAGTFVSFPAEIVRTSSNMLRTVAADLKSDNPKLRELGMKRAAGMALVSSAFWALAALTKAMVGVDDDEEEAIRDLAPKWQKNSTFLYVGRDEKGNLRYFDMSFLDPYGYWKRPITAMMRNQPWEDSLASGLRGMLEPFLGADIAAKAIFEAVANQKESGGKVYKEKDGAIDQTVDIADHLRKTLQPGFVGNIERLTKAAAGVRKSTGQPYSVNDELVALVGWRATTMDPKTALYYRSFDFADAMAEARKTLTDTLRDANSVSGEDIKDARQRAKAKQTQAFSEMHRLVGAAKAAGMTKMQIMQTLKMANISQANIGALMRGATPEVRVTPEAAQKAIRQARTMRGNEYANEVAQRYRQAAADR